MISLKIVGSKMRLMIDLVFNLFLSHPFDPLLYIGGLTPRLLNNLINLWVHLINLYLPGNLCIRLLEAVDSLKWLVICKWLILTKKSLSNLCVSFQLLVF